MTTDTSNGLTAAEIAALTPEGIANENANAPLGVEDIGYTQDRAPELGQERVQSDPTKREVVQRSPSDDVRNQIAARFKRGNEVAFDGDMTNPENLYGDFARAPVEEVDPEPSVVGEPLTPEAPVTPKRKLKVRGQDVELTDDEILAAAQKTLAGDSYLEDARKLWRKPSRSRPSVLAGTVNTPTGNQARKTTNWISIRNRLRRATLRLTSKAWSKRSSSATRTKPLPSSRRSSDRRGKAGRRGPPQQVVQQRPREVPEGTGRISGRKP
jgi:hypothetical protein